MSSASSSSLTAEAMNLPAPQDTDIAAPKDTDIDTDQLRITKDVVDIEVKEEEDLQAKIEEALSPRNRDHVKVLNLHMISYDESITASLCHQMPNLTTLSMEYVHITKLHLTAELTPKLEDLELTGVPPDCDFNVVVPTLKSISIRYYTPDQETLPINNMLAAATNLERFDSYKLWVCGELFFAGNHLRVINLQRSDGLRSVKIWAPNLEHLGLGYCHEMSRVKILKKHRSLDKELPEGHKPSTFTANVDCTSISANHRRTMRRSGRCIIEGYGNKWVWGYE